MCYNIRNKHIYTKIALGKYKRQVTKIFVAYGTENSNIHVTNYYM